MGQLSLLLILLYTQLAQASFSLQSPECAVFLRGRDLDVFRDVIQQLEQNPETHMDRLLFDLASEWRFNSSEIDYKYSAYLDPKPKSSRHYLTSYTTYARGGGIIIQIVRRPPNSSPADAKRRILRALLVQMALKSQGINSILLGYALPDPKLLAKYAANPTYWEFSEDFSFALISREIPLAVNFKGWSQGSAVFSQWSKSDLKAGLNALGLLETVLNRLRLTGEDLQYLIGDKGTLIPVQLDRLVPLSTGEPPLSLEADRILLENLWHKSKEPGKSGWVTIGSLDGTH
jgi:hypothetical protein